MKWKMRIVFVKRLINFLHSTEYNFLSRYVKRNVDRRGKCSWLKDARIINRCGLRAVFQTSIHLVAFYATSRSKCIIALRDSGGRKLGNTSTRAFLFVTWIKIGGGGSLTLSDWRGFSCVRYGYKYALIRTAQCAFKTNKFQILLDTKKI